MSSATRHASQQQVLPDKIRTQKMIAILGAEANPGLARSLVAGAAASGIGVGADNNLPPGEYACHWTEGSLDELTARIDSHTRFFYLDGLLPSSNISSTSDDHQNTSIVVIVNDISKSLRQLNDLVSAGVMLPCLIVMAGPSGWFIGRSASPKMAVEWLEATEPRSKVLPPGPLEHAVGAAGVILHQIITEGQRVKPSQLDDGIQTVAYYCRITPRRVNTTAQATAGEIMEGLATADSEAASFNKRRIHVIGAGSLGTWICLVMAREGATLVIQDGDQIEERNLNRQLLYVDKVGNHKSLAMAQICADINPQGSYAAIPTYVMSHDDLRRISPRPDLVACLPDNNLTRYLVADFCQDKGLLFATAGSSVSGGQSIICHPEEKACIRCVLGEQDQQRPTRQSCLGVSSEAVISTNMVAASLLICELRHALAGNDWVNLQFQGQPAVTGNSLRRILTNVNCPHR